MSSRAGGVEPDYNGQGSAEAVTGVRSSVGLALPINAKLTLLALSISDADLISYSPERRGN